MVSDEQKLKIVEYVKDKPVELVYLFGSQAISTAGVHSDYDIGVLFSLKLDRKTRRGMQLSMMSDFCNVFKTDKIDVVDLQAAPVALCYNVIAPRGEVFVRSKKSLVDFETRTSIKYFDRRPYIEAHTKASLRAFAERGFEK